MVEILVQIVSELPIDKVQQEVHQIEIIPTPPSQRDETMPLAMYPMILKTTTSHEEGCTRKWAINAKEFIKDEAGNLKGLKAVEIEWNKDPVTKKIHHICRKTRHKFTIECDLAFWQWVSYT